jgi:hypothetical protein
MRYPGGQGRIRARFRHGQTEAFQAIPSSLSLEAGPTEYQRNAATGPVRQHRSLDRWRRRRAWRFCHGRARPDHDDVGVSIDLTSF